MTHNSFVSFKLIFYFGLKDPIRLPILRLSSALVKICHIPHFIFQTTSQFFFKFFITHERQLLFTFLGQTLNTLHNRNQWKCKFLRLLSGRVKIHQILVYFKTTDQFFFKFYINLQSHESWLLMMMNCFRGMVDWRKAEPYFQSGPLSEILTIANPRHAASRIWTCTEPVFRLWWMKLCSSDNHYTMYFFSLSFIYFQQKESIKIQSWWNFTWAVESRKFCPLMAPFAQIMYTFSYKSIEELSLMILKSDAKFE